MPESSVAVAALAHARHLLDTMWDGAVLRPHVDLGGGGEGHAWSLGFARGAAWQAALSPTPQEARAVAVLLATHDHPGVDWDSLPAATQSALLMRAESNLNAAREARAP